MHASSLMYYASAFPPVCACLMTASPVFLVVKIHLHLEEADVLFVATDK